MGLGVQRDSRTTLPRGKTRCQLYKRPGGGGYRGPSGLVRKITPPLAFDPWTVQPVVNRYSGYAIPVHDLECV